METTGASGLVICERTEQKTKIVHESASSKGKNDGSTGMYGDCLSGLKLDETISCFPQTCVVLSRSSSLGALLIMRSRVAIYSAFNSSPFLHSFPFTGDANQDICLPFCFLFCLLLLTLLSPSSVSFTECQYRRPNGQSFSAVPFAATSLQRIYAHRSV